MSLQFKNDVYKLLSLIPKGRVMTYGQIAALCGHPGAARTVGQIAHFGPDSLPWHRVVNSRGGVANGFPLGAELQAHLLEKEQIKLTNNKLILNDYLWWPMAQKIKTIAIVGPTASGKTSLAIKIAKELDGEIISADSRALYKQIDIVAAKPTKDEQATVKHWGIDLVNPDQKFSANDFKKYACKKINEIHKRKHIAILVGGSGLYVDSVLYNFSFASPNLKIRKELEGKSVEELQKIIKDKQLSMPINNKNKRHLMRTIERLDHSIQSRALQADTIILGLNPGSIIIKANIKKRVDNMINSGLYEEIQKLLKLYSPYLESMKSNAIVAFSGFIDGSISEEQAIQLAIKMDISLAKRQITWFKRNKDILWFDNSVDAYNWLMSLIKGKL